MTNDVEEARRKANEAAAALERAGRVASVLAYPGLRLARSTDDPGTMLVGYNGSLLGTVNTTSRDAVLQDWYAQPTNGPTSGPYPTARAAAAAMLQASEQHEGGNG